MAELKLTDDTIKLILSIDGLDETEMSHLNMIYSPVYFNTIELELMSGGTMIGGYYSREDNLTFPFNYFVYIIQDNPLFKGIEYFVSKLRRDGPSNQSFKPSLPGAPTEEVSAKSEPEKSSFFDFSRIFSRGDYEKEKSNPLLNGMQDESEKKDNGVSSTMKEIFQTKLSKHEESVSPNSSKQSVDGSVSPNSSKQSVDESVSPNSSKQSVDESVSPNSSKQSVDESVSPNSSKQSVDESVTSQEEEIQIPHNSKVFEFSITNKDEYNGMSLKHILVILKQNVRTCEDSVVSGINYPLFERIIQDLSSQNDYLKEHLKLSYTQIDTSQIFNINGRYVWVDIKGVVATTPQNILETSNQLKREMRNNIYGDDQLNEIINTPIALYLQE